MCATQGLSSDTRASRRIFTALFSSLLLLPVLNPFRFLHLMILRVYNDAGSNSDDKEQDKGTKENTKRTQTYMMSGPIPIQVTEHDVLFGRGGKNCKHAGNQRLRAVARSYKNRYNMSSKKGKSDISRSILAHFRNLDPPGRFLKRDDETGEWIEVSEEVAREKASQTLRDARDGGGGSDEDCSPTASSTVDYYHPNYAHPHESEHWSHLGHYAYDHRPSNYHYPSQQGFEYEGCHYDSYDYDYSKQNQNSHNPRRHHNPHHQASHASSSSWSHGEDANMSYITPSSSLTATTATNMSTTKTAMTTPHNDGPSSDYEEKSKMSDHQREGGRGKGAGEDTGIRIWIHNGEEKGAEQTETRRSRVGGTVPAGDNDCYPIGTSLRHPPPPPPPLSQPVIHRQCGTRELDAAGAKFKEERSNKPSQKYNQQQHDQQLYPSYRRESKKRSVPSGGGLGFGSFFTSSSSGQYDDAPGDSYNAKSKDNKIDDRTLRRHRSVMDEADDGSNPNHNTNQNQQQSRHNHLRRIASSRSIGGGGFHRKSRRVHAVLHNPSTSTTDNDGNGITSASNNCAMYPVSDHEYEYHYLTPRSSMQEDESFASCSSTSFHRGMAVDGCDYDGGENGAIHGSNGDMCAGGAAAPPPIEVVRERHDPSSVHHDNDQQDHPEHQPHATTGNAARSAFQASGGYPPRHVDLSTPKQSMTTVYHHNHPTGVHGKYDVHKASSSGSGSGSGSASSFDPYDIHAVCSDDRQGDEQEDTAGIARGIARIGQQQPQHSGNDFVRTGGFAAIPTPTPEQHRSSWQRHAGDTTQGGNDEHEQAPITTTWRGYHYE